MQANDAVAIIVGALAVGLALGLMFEIAKGK